MGIRDFHRYLINDHGEEPFGLRRYTRENGRGQLYVGPSEFFLKFNDEGQLDMWMECDDVVEHSHPVALCDAAVDYSPYLMLRYHFGREYLEEWRDVEESVRDIIAEFMVPCEETPHDCPIDENNNQGEK